MKAFLSILAAMLIGCVGMAQVAVPFQSWSQVEGMSSDIVIVHCKKLGTRLQPLYYFGSGNYNATVEVLAILKGTTNVTSALIWTDHPLQEAQDYLVFGNFLSEIPRTKVKLTGSNVLSNDQQKKLILPHTIREGDNYVVLGAHETGRESGVYQAYEEYRIIPLGVRFSTNSIAGKPLDEQLQILFKQGLDNLNREIQKDQEEKQRLETALKK